MLFLFPVAAARQGCRGGSHLLPGQSRACGDGPGPGAVQKPAGRRGNPLCGPRSPASPGKTQNLNQSDISVYLGFMS